MYVTCLDAESDQQVSDAGRGYGFWSSFVFCIFDLCFLLIQGWFDRMDERHHPTKRILDLQSHRARNQIRQWQVSAIYEYTCFPF